MLKEAIDRTYEESKHNRESNIFVLGGKIYRIIPDKNGNFKFELIEKKDTAIYFE